MNVFSASDLQVTTASDGRCRHAIRVAGTGQVIPSRAAVIAAAPGRASQQLTPALIGVG
jgi:hypothetical protein